MGASLNQAGLEAPPTSHIAIVLIHGIGVVGSGDVIGSAIKGIGAAFPDVPVLSTDFRVADRPARRLQFRETWMDVVEFHWAAIAGKIRLRRPLRAINQITALVREFPSMAVGVSSPRTLRMFATAIGHTLAALWILWAIALVGSALEVSVRTGPWLSVQGNTIAVVPVTSELFRPASDWLLNHNYYWSFAARWVVFVIAYLAASFAVVGTLLFVVSWPMRQLRPLNALMRTSAASAFVAFLFCGVLSLLHLLVIQYLGEIVGGFDAALILIGVTYLAILIAAFQIALWPANLLRDVVHYLGTNASGVPLADHAEIHRQLRDLIGELRQSPALDRIVLVCHSLGTVIVADFLLAGNLARPESRTIPVDLVTAGSPIRRLINLLLPDRLPRPLEIRRRLRTGALPVARWFNAYRLCDYVGKRLVPLSVNSEADQGIRECPLRPRWRWPLGHANYWQDPRFVEFVAFDVLAPVVN